MIKAKHFIKVEQQVRGGSLVYFPQSKDIFRITGCPQSMLKWTLTKIYLKDFFFFIALCFGAQALTVKINILQANLQACVLKARRHKSFGLLETHTSWQEMKEINITSTLLKM